MLWSSLEWPLSGLCPYCRAPSILIWFTFVRNYLEWPPSGLCPYFPSPSILTLFTLLRSTEVATFRAQPVLPAPGILTAIISKQQCFHSLNAANWLEVCTLWVPLILKTLHYIYGLHSLSASNSKNTSLYIHISKTFFIIIIYLFIFICFILFIFSF